MLPLFESFIRERQYLNNVSPRTLEWHRQSLRCLPCETPTQQQLNDMVIALRARGIKPSGVNCKARSINAYLKWSGQSVKIAAMKEPKLVMPTYSEQDVKRLVQYKAKSKHERKVHLLILLLLDTGARLSEALNVHVSEINMADCLVLLKGKGDRERLVPFSFEMRKHIYRFVQEYKPCGLLLATDTGTAMSRCNALRDVKRLCVQAGSSVPPRALHSMRHTFAASFVRSGASVFHLQKQLGHQTLAMSQKYCSLNVSDLQAVHKRVSLLSK